MIDIEYGHLFADVDLFIVFGCSLGVTDGWWWRRIFRAFDGEPADDELRAELIIYCWTLAEAPASSADVTEKFFIGADVESRDPIRQRVQDRVRLVVYTDQETPIWLIM